ncbi:MAG: hypothetical protein GX456_12340 [Verrucomicrobia bacterium]|nr:hypothetical protein [Verrucomicrobiota bacterium]
MPCDSVARKSALIPMVFHALPRMQRPLVSSKRLECGSLLPLCLMHKQRACNQIGMTPQTTCLSPYPIFPISPMTGHATRFDPANRTTEHTPVGCGEESPRSCLRVRRNTDGRERGRPRPHQRDDQPYDPFGSRKCGARTFTGWGCPNNVPVPISASERFLRSLRQSRIGTRGNLKTTQQLGAKPQQRACHFIQLTPKGPTVVTALLAANEGDTDTLTKLTGGESSKDSSV